VASLKMNSALIRKAKMSNEKENVNTKILNAVTAGCEYTLRLEKVPRQTFTRYHGYDQPAGEFLYVASLTGAGITLRGMGMTPGQAEKELDTELNNLIEDRKMYLPGL